MSDTFALRLRGGERLHGTFIKTPHHHHAEIAGIAGLDFIVIDAEHAPFGAAQLDAAVLGARAGGTAALIRLTNGGAESVLRVLDMGATGILVPHVTTAQQAAEIVASAHYATGTRGFSTSPRAGKYGLRSMTTHVTQSDAETVVICQIEDREAVDAIEAIAATPGIDCLFIGRADLAVSYRAFDLAHPEVIRATNRIIDAGRSAGVPVGMFVSDAEAAAPYADRGVSLFVVGSDQAMLATAFARLAQKSQAR